MTCAFNAHKWDEVGRVFVPPPAHLKSLKLEAEQGTIERLTMGITSVELRCTVCNSITEITLLGDHTKEEK